MYYRDLFTYYLAKGGDTSRETSFGDRNWDDVVDPEMQTRLEVVFNHDTGDVRAVRPDRTIILVGNITARWGMRRASGGSGSQIEGTGHRGTHPP